MPTTTFSGLSVDVTEDGFFTNPEQWRETWRAKSLPEKPSAT
jgi:hypothetical protein